MKVTILETNLLNRVYPFKIMPALHPPLPPPPIPTSMRTHCCSYFNILVKTLTLICHAISMVMDRYSMRKTVFTDVVWGSAFNVHVYFACTT